MNLRHLVKQCQSGDREAFGILYQTYIIPMQDIVSYYVRDSEAVRDILHDGFLIAFVSISSLKNTSKIEAWLTSIMKNLALQYIKKESNHISVPLSDEYIAYDSDKYIHTPPELTWEELNNIINQLPEGYEKVFRLAVLDGMSHKEIGSMLGIAPHSSSSQLAHAKAMMRRIITEYRGKIGALSIVAIALLVWNGLFRHKNDTLSNTAISRNSDKKSQALIDTVIDKETKPYSGDYIKRAVPKPLYPDVQIQEDMAIIALYKDSASIQEPDLMNNDTIRKMPRIIDCGEFVAKEDLPLIKSNDSRNWSLSLAYSGTLQQNDYNKHRIPHPDFPDVEGPAGEIEITEKARHHIPAVISLSLSKSLNSRWGIETGLRYSFLRSEFLSESNLTNKETIYRIHYIGVPLKFSYRIFACNGFSLYGHGGGALDIPVYGSLSVWEYSIESGTTNADALKIHDSMLWSAEGGLGIQYRFTPSLSIYAEPSFRYYFTPGSEIKTIRQEKPFEFSIPIGLRITW